MPKMSFTDFLPAGAYRLRRAAVMTVGVLFMGFAVAALVQADLGTDPFTTACLAFAARMGWLLGSAELLVNAVMFCLVLWQDPHRIGLGTLANMVLVGYTADFFGWVFRLCGITAPAGGAARFVFMVAAIAVFVVAASLYMTGDHAAPPALPRRTHGVGRRVGRADARLGRQRRARHDWHHAFDGSRRGPCGWLGKTHALPRLKRLFWRTARVIVDNNNVIKGVLAYGTTYFLDW